TVSHLIAATATALVFAAAGFLLFVALSYVFGGYTPGDLIQLGPDLLGVTIFVLILIGLVTLGGILVARIVSQIVANRIEGRSSTLPEGSTLRRRVRTSIRARLAVSHLVAVTASALVYAAGGFFLLVALLYLVGGYTPRGMIQLVPQFLGVTVFVLVQIGLITLCGILAARLVSQIVANRMLKQIAELEEGSNAIASGHLDRKVAVLSDDELGRLAGRFNYLTSRLSAADNQRRAFVANISHDLRTPIAVIRGHLDAQRDADGTNDIPPQASFDAIAHETATLSRLIDDLFTLSRLEEGVLPISAVPVDLATLACDAVAAVRSYALKTARVSVNAQIADPLSAVLGDPTRITQIINNLLHNAVRHTPEGGLVVLQAHAAGKEWVEVLVRDTGVGISSEVLGKIFDRYYRGDSIGENGGAGIGLSIVKQLVEMQGGTVWAESTVGEGTAVTFRLPAILGPVHR
ncbi:MAG: ATP-binding protein, partial [Chloroflexota bacterium]|nr:ATP-binding protein [Chloroflexota bacterium]